MQSDNPQSSFLFEQKFFDAAHWDKHYKYFRADTNQNKRFNFEYYVSS